MTDEERQKLLANLYSVSRDDNQATLCYEAADEIGRLAALPHPDASAGLIEAAERAEHFASECDAVKVDPAAGHVLRDLARDFRSRAADRSGK